MGKFERAFRKKYRQEVPPYEVWRAENSHRFPQPAQSPEQIENGHVMAKRRFPAWGWGVLAGAAVLLALILTLVFLLRDRPSSLPEQPGSIPDLTFGEDSIAMQELTEDVYEQCVEIVPSITEMTEIRLMMKAINIDNGSLVMAIINGDVETETDYFFVELRIVFNQNFIISDIGQYQKLDSSIAIGEMQIFYGVRGTDQYGFTEYNVLSEYEDVTIYWTVSSINDHFDEWLQLTFAA